MEVWDGPRFCGDGGATRYKAAPSETFSDHTDGQPLAVGGAVAAQDTALVINGSLALHD